MSVDTIGSCARGRRPRARLPGSRGRPAGAPRRLVRDRSADSRTGSWASRAAGSRLPLSASSATSRATAAITGGSISVAGRDVLALGRRGLRDYHARTVSMVYQNPGSALNPSLRVGTQIVEAFTVLGVPGKDALARASRDARDRADRGPRERHEPLPPPALGRHAAARGDRHGAREEPGAAHTRRADDRARRDRRSRGARPRQPAPSGAAHVGALHQPQPRRDLEDVLDGRGALRRAARRGGPRRDRPPGSAPSLYGRPASVHPARRRAQGSRPARHDPRLPPAARHRAGRLRVRRPLRPRGRALPRGGTTVLRVSPATREQVLVPRSRARPSLARKPQISSFRGWTGRSLRSSSSTSSRRSSRSGATTCTRSPASLRRSGRVRRWGSSASRAAGRRRSRAASQG